MSTSSVAPSSYADFSGLTALKTNALDNDPAAIREVARQFESLFTRMLLKSMREASLGEGLGDSDATDFYQDMYDQQLAVTLSQGEGLGLASRLVEQLLRASAGTPAVQSVPVGAATGAAAGREQQFIDALRPAATRAAEQLGVAVENIIAHAALETGWGASLPKDGRGSSYNLFGIKASGGGDRTTAMTTEYVNGQFEKVAQPFRRYESHADSVLDYAALLGTSPRYAGVRKTGGDTLAFATALKQGGYATDPDYVAKLVAVAATVRQKMAAAQFKAGDNAPISAHG